MTGPPTPPPTSEIEIIDAARNPVPPQAASSSNPPQSGAPAKPIGVYQLLFPTIADLALKGSYRELVKVAERGDLTVEGDGHISRLLLITPLVLSYLILDEISAAQFALMRLPKTLTSLQLPQSLFNLLAAASVRKYENVYARAEHVYDALKKPVVPEYDLTSVARTLVKAFVDTFRKKTLVLLSRAYTSISASLAQSYLGLSAEQTIQAAKVHKWSYDVSNQVLHPVPIKGDASSTTGAIGQSTLHTLQTVTAGNFEEK